MEKEPEKEVKSVVQKFLGCHQKQPMIYYREDVKEILHDVLNELYYSKGRKPTYNGNYGRY